MITGTIRNNVQLACLDQRWQQRKEKLAEGKPQEEMAAAKDAGGHTLRALGVLLDLAADGATMEAAAGTDISINVVC